MAPSVEPMKAAASPVPYYSNSLRTRFHMDATKTLSRDSSAGSYRPDISYEPDEVRYRARVEKRLAAGGLPKSVPPGFPLRLEGPLVWKGKDLDGHEDGFVHQLSSDDVAEIGTALQHFKGLALDSDQVRPDTFPLPGLANRLRTICEDIYEGKGIAIIRGLDPQLYSDEDFTIVYLGVTSYVASRRGKQDQRGSMLMHVLRKNQPGKTQEENSYNADQPFHTDTVCDCLCLVAKSCSAKGGKSILASAWSVYNELAATRPDLIHTLAAADWPFDTYNRSPPYYRRAIMYFDSGKLIINLSRRLLLGKGSAPRSTGIPNINEAQAEALDAIHFAAKKVQLCTTIRRGDIRLINNMALLHCREAFIDDGPKNTRHLVRVWLNNELMCWKLPSPLRLAWARVFEDSDREEHWDLMPARKDGIILRIAGSCD